MAARNPPIGAPPSPSSVTSSLVLPTRRRASAFMILRRLLRYRGSVALGRGAAQVAHRVQVVVAAHAMHGRAIVPDHQIVLGPFVRVDELALGGVLREVADEAHGLGPWPPQDGADMRRQEQR